MLIICNSFFINNGSYIWEKGKGILLKKLEGPKEGLSDVKWHPKRPLIASLSSLGRVFLWSVNYVQNFSAFAPSFTETDDNVEYIEREDEFDQKQVIIYHNIRSQYLSLELMLMIC